MSISDLSKDEIQAIQQQNCGEHLPQGWYFDGRMYMNFDGEVKFEHPNLQLLLQNYVAEKNN